MVVLRIVLWLIVGIFCALSAVCAIGSAGGDNGDVGTAGLLLLPAIALGTLAVALAVTAWQL